MAPPPPRSESEVWPVAVIQCEAVPIDFLWFSWVLIDFLAKTRLNSFEVFLSFRGSARVAARLLQKRSKEARVFLTRPTPYGGGGFKGSAHAADPQDLLIFWFSLYFHDFQWFSLVFIDFYRYRLFSWVFNYFHWFSLIFNDLHWHSLIFIDLLLKPGQCRTAFDSLLPPSAPWGWVLSVGAGLPPQTPPNLMVMFLLLVLSELFSHAEGGRRISNH